MEIIIKTNNDKEFIKIIEFLGEENITIINTSEIYKSTDDLEDFKVMEEEIKKYRVKLPKDFEFNRDEANER